MYIVCSLHVHFTVMRLQQLKGSRPRPVLLFFLHFRAFHTFFALLFHKNFDELNQILESFIRSFTTNVNFYKFSRTGAFYAQCTVLFTVSSLSAHNRANKVME